MFGLFKKKINASIYFPSGKFHAFDDKWEAKYKKHTDKTDAIQAQIDILEDVDEITPDAQKKIDKLLSDIDKLDEAFSKIESAYTDKQYLQSARRD